MINAIINYASRPDDEGQPTREPYTSMTYGPILNDKHGRHSFHLLNGNPNELPASKGVYFVLSHNRTRLQKIGMANGANGLKQRIKDYVNRPKLPLTSTTAFWNRIMTGSVEQNEEPMPGDYEILDLYFKSLTAQEQTNEPLAVTCGINTLSYDPHADLERALIAHAITLRAQYLEENPLGFPKDYNLPLLLDSDNRLTSNQFI